ncbi:MAG TPA: Os1348 family NHLP clan protein [Chloroflexota bacterium]|jgi:hypothetical protein|nr:Os1348 family NHLP clan protein [Chloroflexota bacterium]
MSQQSLARVIERWSTDEAFRAAVQRDPDTALVGYDLTAEERAALIAGDADRLEALGVEARVTKFGGTSFFDSENANPFASDAGS